MIDIILGHSKDEARASKCSRIVPMEDSGALPLEMDVKDMHPACTRVGCPLIWSWIASCFLLKPCRCSTQRVQVRLTKSDNRDLGVVARQASLQHGALPTSWLLATVTAESGTFDMKLLTTPHAAACM